MFVVEQTAASDVIIKLTVAHVSAVGNTCYINSILQVLYRTPGFVNFVSEVAVQLQLAVQLYNLSDNVSCFCITDDMLAQALY